MAPDLLAIDPRPAIVIDPAEMQKDPFTIPIFRNGKRPMIPDRRNEIGVSHAGQTAFRTEGNKNLLAEIRRIGRPVFLIAA